nr:hypothetical protein MarFTME_344 [Marseillevirus futianmevirus]
MSFSAGIVEDAVYGCDVVLFSLKHKRTTSSFEFTGTRKDIQKIIKAGVQGESKDVYFESMDGKLSVLREGEELYFEISKQTERGGRSSLCAPFEECLAALERIVEEMEE